MVVGGGGAVAGGSCTSWISAPSIADYWDVAASTGGGYIGQGGFDPGTNKTICQVDINVKTISGNISAIDWQIEISAMSGTTLGVPGAGCTSAKKITATGTNLFTGLTCAVTSGTSYGIVITRSDHLFDAINNITVYTNNADGSLSGTMRQWYNDDATQKTDYSPADFGVVIYAQ